MTRLFDFLKEADAESIRRSHRRRAKEIAASMSIGASSNKEVPDTTTSSRRSVQRTPVSKITGREAGPSLIPTAERRPKFTVGRQRKIRSGGGEVVIYIRAHIRGNILEKGP